MILTYQKKDGSVKTVRVKTVAQAPVVTIGRGSDSDICIDDAKASRINTGIRYWDDIFVIRDMKSSNGTYVNGKKIDVAVLNAGDVIKIGDTEIHVKGEEAPSEVTVRRST